MGSQCQNRISSELFFSKRQDYERSKSGGISPNTPHYLDNDYELQYWTEQLKVTNDELKEAVATVGNSLDAVKVYLNKA